MLIVPKLGAGFNGIAIIILINKGFLGLVLCYVVYPACASEGMSCGVVQFLEFVKS